MPNYVANILTLAGSEERIAKVVEFVKGEDSPFDFSKIVPQPETYKKYDTTNHPDGRGLEVGQPVNPFKKDSPIVTKELLEEYKQATAEQARKYGVVGWYDWNVRYWGTKWDAMDVTYEGGAFFFDTAWSAPLPVIRRLAEMFPDILFVLTYADEDYGYNCARYTFKGKQRDCFAPAGGSDEAMELYFETHPDSRDEMHKDENGDWVWND